MSVLEFVADPFYYVLDLFDDLVASLFWVIYCSVVYLIDTDNQLFDSKSISQKQVLFSLSIFWNTCLKFLLRSSYNQYGAVSLWGSSDHGLNKLPVSWSIDNGDVMLSGFKLRIWDIDGGSPFSFKLKLTKNPSIFERRRSCLNDIPFNLLEFLLAYSATL